MLNRILVPVDGSPFAEHALPHAIGVAARLNAELHLLLAHHVTLGVDAGWMPQPELFAKSIFDSEERYLSSLRDRLAAAGVQGTYIHHKDGAPAELLTDFAEEHDIDLIVMSTHGRGGLQRAYIGSVADGVLRRAHRPVLLVRPGEEGEVRFRGRDVRRILVAVDGSVVAERALAVALEVATVQDAHCTLLQVVVPPIFISSYMPDTARLTHEELDSATRHAQEYLAELESKVPGVDEVRVVEHQQPAVAILKEADAVGADMIAIGTRGLGKVARFFIGSVADKVVRGADVPVLVVPRKD